jgi:hypothetical protein
VTYLLDEASARWLNCAPSPGPPRPELLSPIPIPANGGVPGGGGGPGGRGGGGPGGGGPGGGGPAGPPPGLGALIWEVPSDFEHATHVCISMSGVAASADVAPDAAATESKQASRQKQVEHRARLKVRQRERVAARLRALIASALAPTVPAPSCARLPMGVCGPHQLISGTTGVLVHQPVTP